jgi:hypothetical protein
MIIFVNKVLLEHSALVDLHCVAEMSNCDKEHLACRNEDEDIYSLTLSNIWSKKLPECGHNLS